MKKTIFVAIVALLLNLGLVNAITQQEIKEAKSLIDSKADCKSLSEPQLEIIGEYYMEQMHPGESHELMHKMMGIKEGSEAEKQLHINMAKTMYCNEDAGVMGAGTMSGGMMSMMMGGNMGYGMMENQGYGFVYWNFLNVLYVLLLIGLIILVYLWIIKLWKTMENKKDKPKK